MTEFRVLGPVQIWPLGPTADLGPPKQRAVLAALLVDAGRPVGVDVVLKRVWGDEPPAQARSALYSHIMRIRRALDAAGPDGGTTVLVRGSAGYTLAVDPDQVDLHRFRRLVVQAGTHPDGDVRRLELLREAVALWRGQPLAGIGGDWAERMRESWQQQYVDAMVAYAYAELAIGDPAAVCGPLRELSVEYPLVEPLAAVLIRVLGAVGRTAEALEYYAACRRRLVDELGTDPGPELQAVHQALLRGECDPPRTPVVATPPPAPRVIEPGVRQGTGRKAALATRGMLGLCYLAVALVAVRSAGGFTGAMVALTVSIAISAVLTLVYARWPRTRWFPAAVVAVVVAGIGAVAPTRPAGGPFVAPSIVSRPSGSATVWTAHTTEQAPFFATGGVLTRTLPAGFTVQVQCRYRGNPPKPWRTTGFQYHVIVPDDGHIPEPYLTFGGPDPVTTALHLPRCTPKR